MSMPETPSIPLVSVVIPTYNHAQFLTKALESVINQTFKNWEIIVVNNYSSDNTIEVVESFNDLRIHLINFHNQGIIAAARNEGIRHAKAKYIAFLDSDDFWLPEKLSTCLNFLETNQCDITCNSEDYIDQNGNTISTWHHGPVERTRYENLLFKGNCISTSAVIVKKELLLTVGVFNEDRSIVTAEDYDLWLKLSDQRTILFHK